MSDTLFPSDVGTTLKPWQTTEPIILARVHDPKTSHDAAKALGGKAGTMRRNLLLAFVLGAQTAEEASYGAGYTPADGAWKRVSDLVNLGLVEPRGDTRRARSGRQQRVLRITAKGREALA